MQRNHITKMTAIRDIGAKTAIKLQISHSSMPWAGSGISSINISCSVKVLSSLSVTIGLVTLLIHWDLLKLFLRNHPIFIFIKIFYHPLLAKLGLHFCLLDSPFPFVSRRLSNQFDRFVIVTTNSSLLRLPLPSISILLRHMNFSLGEYQSLV